MAVNEPHLYDPGVYFVTFTNCKWRPLFELSKSYDLVYKWFDLLKSKGHNIVGYVIMPNHVHALIAYASCNKSINTVIGNGKRFMAYDIVERLEQEKQTELLSFLAKGVNASDRRRGKLHEVFEPSFDAKICHGYNFINQKLAYMHANPVNKKWMLAANEIEYVHSSARFYQTGQQGVYEVINFMELETVLEQKAIT